jgi:hypothetical protein
MEKMTEDEFLQKVEWEGGVVEALEYGLRADMLKDPNIKLGRLWKSLETAWLGLQPLMGAVESYFEDWQEGDESYMEEDYAG